MYGICVCVAYFTPLLLFFFPQPTPLLSDLALVEASQKIQKDEQPSNDDNSNSDSQQQQPQQQQVPMTPVIIEPPVDPAVKFVFSHLCVVLVCAFVWVCVFVCLAAQLDFRKQAKITKTNK